MKTLFAILAIATAALIAFADPAEGVPQTAVVVSTTEVTKTVTREPRLLEFRFDKDTGAVTASVIYMTVTRIDGVVTGEELFKTVNLDWSQIVAGAPAMSNALPQFQAASRVSLSSTNTP